MFFALVLYVYYTQNNNFPIHVLYPLNLFFSVPDFIKTV